MNEGVIKFVYEWKKKHLPEKKNISELILYRNKLYNDGLIGADKDGTGYGNISLRYGYTGKFIISGSDTGRIKTAGKNHFTLVNSVNVKKNLVYCTGMKVASSESMTHFIMYDLSREINCVIHVHNLRLWKALLNKVPTTSKNISYGSSAIVQEIIKLWQNSDLREKKIVVMNGHIGGLIVFGKSIKDVYNLLIDYLSA